MVLRIGIVLRPLRPRKLSEVVLGCVCVLIRHACGWHTFASQSSKLAPSAPDQNRDRITIDCAMISCGSRSKMPEASSSLVVSKRTESSKSFGMPSSCDADVSK